MLIEHYAAWDVIVRDYMVQKLTKGEDKLIAIQALAQAMRETVDDRYFAGLWESRITADQLWAVDATANARFSRPAV